MAIKVAPKGKSHQSKRRKRHYRSHFLPKTQLAQTQPVEKTVTIVGSTPDGSKSFFMRFRQLKFNFPNVKMRATQLAVLALILVALATSSAGVYFWKQNQKLAGDPSKVAQNNAKELVDKVGKLIELPVGEDPVVATVSDKDKLKNQSFFTKAENGDNVLIYSQSRKAILYRNSTNKVIEVATLNINTGDNQGQVAGEKEAPKEASPGTKP